MSPELLLKCARKAYPNVAWKLSGIRTSWDVISNEEGFAFFDHTNFDDRGLADQMALQIALEKEGWVFGFFDNSFCAHKDNDMQYDNITAPTKPGLLSQCVEASQ